MERQTILLVDDDAAMCETLTRFLALEGYGVNEAPDAESVNIEALTDVALVLCEVNLPDENGFDLTKRIRSHHPNIGLIMLTRRAALIDRILGLELGADDYVLKPVELRELLARIRSLLRRQRRQTPVRIADPQTTNLGGWIIDHVSRCVTSPEGREIGFTATEFNIFQMLSKGRGQVITRETLYEVIKGKEWSPIDRTLDTHIANIRRKLGRLGYTSLLKTIHGLGYGMVLSK